MRIRRVVEAGVRRWRYRLRRTSLRVTLVALVLLLVSGALVAGGVASTVALRSYLMNRVDEELAQTVERVRLTGLPVELRLRAGTLPSDFLLARHLPIGTHIFYDERRYDVDQLPPVPADLFEALDQTGRYQTVTAPDGMTRWRISVALLPDGSAVTVAENLADVDSAVDRLVAVEVLGGAVVLTLLAFLGALTVRRSLRPLEEIERTADAIAAGDLTRRVPEPTDGPPRTEVERLARALNAMLAQIERAFADRAASEERALRSEERMRRFVADASHELRTPLTTIRGFAELYRQGAAASPEQTAAVLERIEREAARMGLLVEDLLLLARLDQQRPLSVEPVDLVTVVDEAVEAARAVDPERPIVLEVASGAAPVVQGDEARLRQVVGNLLSNALTHTPAGTPVTVRVTTTAESAVVEVADQGPGLTPEQAERVFERFYRVDAARGRPTAGTGSGAGLGLPIVAALVSAHGGTVDVDTAPGRGATFRVVLPLAASADAHDDGHEGADGNPHGDVQADATRTAGADPAGGAHAGPAGKVPAGPAGKAHADATVDAHRSPDGTSHEDLYGTSDEDRRTAARSRVDQEG